MNKYQNCRPKKIIIRGIGTPDVHKIMLELRKAYCSSSAEEIQLEAAVWVSDSRCGERERGVTETCWFKLEERVSHLVNK